MEDVHLGGHAEQGGEEDSRFTTKHTKGTKGGIGAEGGEGQSRVFGRRDFRGETLQSWISFRIFRVFRGEKLFWLGLF